jgi:hypothetical protein
MESLAKRIALCILFIPFALVAIWLDAPWWSVSLLIGVFLFACCASWESELISFKVAAASLGLFVVLGVAAYVVATNIGVSIGELTQDHSLSKYVRRLPEYSLSCLSFLGEAGHFVAHNGGGKSAALAPNYSFKRTAATGCGTIMRARSAAA